MANPLLKAAVRSLFVLTSRQRALAQSAQMRAHYDQLAAGLSEAAGRRAIEVPPMPGVDEDMRRWSFFQLLEHNVIVSRSITTLTEQLARGEPLSGLALLNPKHDVMPSAEAGPEQVIAHRESIDAHLAAVNALGSLRGTTTAPHPLFGPFDAHKWHCMFAFHLRLHYRQAEWVVACSR